MSVEGPKESDIPKNYFVPNLGLDKDIVTSQNNLKATEKILGVWNAEENVQLWITREPLMSIANKVPDGELDYGSIPNRG